MHTFPLYYKGFVLKCFKMGGGRCGMSFVKISGGRDRDGVYPERENKYLWLNKGKY